MDVNIAQHTGVWDLGYSLDKHTVSSVYTGDNQWGHPEFDTTRSEAGEALFRLKYRFDFNQVPIIASQMHDTFVPLFNNISLIVPMPPSRARARQPVCEIAQNLAARINVPYMENLLVKVADTPQMKDIESREEKVRTLISALSVNDVLANGLHDVLIVDDLFDSGSSLEAASTVLRGYDKIQNLYISTVTRK